MIINGDSGARSDRFSIKGSDFEKMPIPIPTPDEQNKIGSFLEKLFSTIELHQRKLEQLELLKNAYLKQMFPKKDEVVPKLRFYNFDDEWKQCELGSVGYTYAGLSGKNKDDFGHGNAKYITYINVFSNPIADFKMLDRIEIDQKQNQVKYGDVLFTTSSETPDDVGMSSVWLYNENNVYLNSFCFGFRPTIDIDPYYLAYMLRSNEVRNQFKILAQGISRYNISKIKAMKINIPLPSLDEQKIIGTYLKTLDENILFHKNINSLYKELKQSYLQKLFV